MLGQLGRHKTPAKSPFRLVRMKRLLVGWLDQSRRVPVMATRMTTTWVKTPVFKALQTAGARPFVMPVSACMDHFTKRRVALWDFNRLYDQFAGSEGIAWFNMAFEEELRDLDSLKKCLETTIRLVVNVLDAESRVGKMLDELMKALERNNQEWILYEEGKAVVDLMVKAVRPSMYSRP
ncbi:hypothetical protein DYB32_008306 [Aphanomyces invadans]|uniref:Uncharacterized protein n=1 Tax=Aphanomyces invadans TaxID=157072 RepID=A0A3R7CVP7_9STRA|nr:hypothetical protein DYB32_008306 [Aphanomyces invadans]